MPSDRVYSRFSMSLPAGTLRALGKLNVPLYRLTRGRVLGKVGRAPVLLLTSTGRRTGQQRTAPVVFLRDADRVVVIGSNAGNTHAPAWSHNLKANPDAEIEIRGERRQVRARVAEGEERSDLWQQDERAVRGVRRLPAAHLARHRRVRARAALAASGYREGRRSRPVLARARRSPAGARRAARRRRTERPARPRLRRSRTKETTQIASTSSAIRALTASPGVATSRTIAPSRPRPRSNLARRCRRRA